jgi:hypothetical protein
MALRLLEDEVVALSEDFRLFVIAVTEAYVLMAQLGVVELLCGF